MRRIALALACLSLACPGPSNDEWEEAFDASEVGWLLSVWGPSPDDLYAVGGDGTPSRGVVWHRDGDGWAAVDLGIDVPLLNWVYGFGPDDIFIVGDEGTIVHWNGTTFETQDSPTDQDLWGVWGAANDALYAVGGNPFPGGTPTVLRYDGSAWTEATDLPMLSRANVFAFFKVWGTGPDDVWVVGQRGAVIHWNGSTWSEELIGTGEDLISLWGTGPDRIAVVGGRGNGWLFTYDGSTWEGTQPGALPGFNGVWMRDPNVVHVVGVEGQIATFDFDTRELLSDDYQDTRLDFHAIYGDGDRLTAVGGNFNMPMGPFMGLAWERDLSGGE